MKNFILFIAFIGGGFISSCKKASTETLNQIIDATDTTTKLVYQGVFMSGPSGTVTGNANVYVKEGKYV